MQQPLCGLALLLGSLIVTPGMTLAAANSGEDAADLRRFVQSVVETNPRVQAARAALESSGAQRRAASRPLYNPELTLDAENASSDTRSVGISQSIDWGGKRTARTAVAESNRQVVEAEYRATQWQVTVELLEGLAQYQTGLARDRLAAERVDITDQFATLARRRFDAGDLNQVESDLATLALTDARIQQATAAAGLAEARQVVRNLSPHAPPKRWPALPAQLPKLPASAADPAALVLTLPGVQAARRQVDAADATVDLRRRQRRPDPTVSLAGGKEDDDTLVGLNLSIPLFVRNRFSHEVTAAMADRNQAQQIADDLLQRAHARLISATERYELARDAWQDWERTGQVSLTRQSDQLQRLWEAGELGTTDYLVQLRQTLDVRASALDLRQTLWRAWFEWLWASGQVTHWLDQGAAQ